MYVLLYTVHTTLCKCAKKRINHSFEWVKSKTIVNFVVDLASCKGTKKRSSDHGIEWRKPKTIVYFVIDLASHGWQGRGTQPASKVSNKNSDPPVEELHHPVSLHPCKYNGCLVIKVVYFWAQTQIGPFATLSVLWGAWLHTRLHTHVCVCVCVCVRVRVYVCVCVYNCFVRGFHGRQPGGRRLDPKP